MEIPSVKLSEKQQNKEFFQKSGVVLLIQYRKEGKNEKLHRIEGFLQRKFLL